MEAFIIQTLSPAFSGASLIGLTYLVFTVQEMKLRQAKITKKVDAIFNAFNYWRGAEGLPAIEVND